MKKNLTLSVALLTALFTLFAAGTVWKLADAHTHTNKVLKINYL